MSWEFFLEPLAERRTRLLVRGRASSQRPAGGAGKPASSPRPIERVCGELVILTEDRAAVQTCGSSPMTRREKLGNVVKLCHSFLLNLASYRAGWNNEHRHLLEMTNTVSGDFWRKVNGNFIDMCVLEWCKLFGLAAVVVIVMLIAAAAAIAAAIVVVSARQPDRDTANHEGKRDSRRNPAELRKHRAQILAMRGRGFHGHLVFPSWPPPPDTMMNEQIK